ncbi:hypothetical protein XENOCAPTIV_008013 [Xenoophorus captivus]|uniref:SH3 domain-containing protein n=1 Tax=Xenoophorus captivus TaxID=1517983 RepID=A0ABV0RG64_9TELE
MKELFQAINVSEGDLVMQNEDIVGWWKGQLYSALTSLRTSKLFYNQSSTHSNTCSGRLHCNHSCPGAQLLQSAPPGPLTTISRQDGCRVSPKDTTMAMVLWDCSG